MQDKGLFREKAAEKLSSPEKIDQLLIVMTPLGWVALLTLFALILAFLIWAFVGEIPVSVQGKGIILSKDGVFNIEADKNGLVSDVQIANNQMVKKGDVIARLGAEETLIVPSDGRILEVYVKKGDFLKSGDKVAWIQFPESEGEIYYCYAYFPVAMGEKIQPKMQAKISPVGIDVSTYGFLIGTVQEVSEFPASENAMYNLFRNHELVLLLKQGNPSVTQVKIALNRDANTYSGYQWTSKKGPEQRIASGMISGVSIILQTRRPISYLFPGLGLKNK